MNNWKGREALNNIKPYSPGKSTNEVKEEYRLDRVYKMASNENPLGPSKKATEKIKEVLNEVHIYPDGSSNKLKKAIALKLGVMPSKIIVGNGSDEIIKIIGESFLTENSNIIMGDPSFSEYDYIGNLMGTAVKKIPFVKEKFDLGEILKAIDDNTSLVAIYNPNNPTGSVIDKEELISFIDKIPENIIVILDEAYGEYAGEDFYSGIDLIKEGRKNIIVLKTFSEIFGLAALSVDYGIADKKLIDWILRAKEPFNVNYLAQITGEAAINDEEHIRRSLKLNSQGKDYLTEEFIQRGYIVYPSSANFLWVDTKLDSKKIFEELLKKGYVIRPGFIFGAPTFIRITIDEDKVNKGFIKALDDVLKAER